eukprot:GHVP01006545.1.p1 GENE.GHVP01006545.1~~GHVP01006545.1.p1  ORF type:complete len:108 (-),score=11.22 GHVP01006545.1:127-450(-)
MKIQIYRPTFRQLKGTENVVSERLDEKAGDDISDDESYTAPDFNKGIMLNTVTAIVDRGLHSIQENPAEATGRRYCHPEAEVHPVAPPLEVGHVPLSLLRVVRTQTS